MAEISVVDDLLSGNVGLGRSAPSESVLGDLLSGNVTRESPGNSEFATRAASMSPIDLSIARSKNDDFGDFLRAQATERQPDETDPEMFKRQFGDLPVDVGTGEGVGRALVQGGTFGSGDEIVAVGAAALNRMISRNPDMSFDELYDTYLARERDKLDQFREDSPVLAFGSEIAGAIPTAVLAAPAGVAATFGGRLAAGAATGAVQGGVFGFNVGEGGLEERAKSAAVGAAIGGGIGLAAPAVGGGVRRLIENRAAKKLASDVGQDRVALDSLRRATESDRTLGGPGAARIAQGGKDAMLVDAGKNTQELLDLAIQKSGPAGAIGREAVEARATEAAKSITGALDDALGAPQGVQSVARGIASKTAASRQEGYEAAYEQPIDYASEVGRTIEEILDRIPPRIGLQAIEDANEMMLVEGRKRTAQMVASLGDDGTVQYIEQPGVMQLDYIKRALGEIAADTKDEFGRRSGKGNRIQSIARNLRRAVGEAVPEYDEAVRLGGEKIQTDRALKLGREMLRPSVTREAVEEGFEDLSVDARQAAMQGLRGHIDDSLANVKRTVQDDNVGAREAIKAVKDLSSRASREKVELLLGDEQATRLFTEIDRVTEAFNLRAAVSKNSATFAREDLNKSIAAQTRDGIINAAKSGEALEVPRRITQAISNRTPKDVQRIEDKTFSALTKLLTGPRGAEALRIIQEMEATQARLVPALQAPRIAERAIGQNTAVSGPLQR